MMSDISFQWVSLEKISERNGEVTGASALRDNEKKPQPKHLLPREFKELGLAYYGKAIKLNDVRGLRR